MPKDGLSSAQWKERLQKYARGKFLFQRGQKPHGKSRWNKELAAIEKCPKHKTTSATDVYGNRIVCRCGYHDPLPPPSNPGSAGSSVAGVGGSHTHQCAVQPPSTTMAQPTTSSSMPSSSPHLRFSSVRCDVAPVLPSGPRRRPSKSPSPCPQGAPRLQQSPSRDQSLASNPPSPFSLGPPQSPRQSRKRPTEVQSALVLGSETASPPAPGNFADQLSSVSPEPKRPCPDPALSTSLREEVSIIATSK